MLIATRVRQATLALLLTGTAVAGHATLVLPNNPSGDLFTNATGVNQGQAIGASGWYYTNVRSSGAVGVNGTYARSGNGSAQIQTATGASKADLSYLAGGACAVNCGALGTLGALSDLSAMQYDWYRSAASTANANQHPALKVLVDRDGVLGTTGDRGELIFELVYNGGPALLPTNSWETSSINTASYFWSSGLGLPFAANINATPYAYDATLAEWQAFMPNAAVLGFTVGVGSGWNSFDGAVDNVGWTIDGAASTYNFELSAQADVPEPASLLLAGLALFGAAAAKRRRRS